MAADLQAPSNGKPDADQPEDKTSKVKAEKPDEEKYKADLAKAEKEHAGAQERLVCLLL